MNFGLAALAAPWASRRLTRRPRRSKIGMLLPVTGPAAGAGKYSLTGRSRWNARLGDPQEPRGDVDAVAHQIAVALLDDIAQMNADAELDAPLGR
jgi:hypothetical protein